MPTVNQMIADIIRRESDKYTNIPGDRGGPTKDGVTLTYMRGRGLAGADLNHDGVIDERDVMMVTPDIAAAYFKEDFFVGPNIDKLPALIHPLMFDMAVNHGPARAIIILQKVLTKLLGRFIVADGRLGAGTSAAAFDAYQKHGFKAFEDALVDAREAFYAAIVAADPSQEKFRKGWMNRAEEFRV